MIVKVLKKPARLSVFQLIWAVFFSRENFQSLLSTFQTCDSFSSQQSCPDWSFINWAISILSSSSRSLGFVDGPLMTTFDRRNHGIQWDPAVIRIFLSFLVCRIHSKISNSRLCSQVLEKQQIHEIGIYKLLLLCFSYVR